jgi:cyclophilin family peptidyl-prolyl cis-trans isomerase
VRPARLFTACIFAAASFTACKGGDPPAPAPSASAATSAAPLASAAAPSPAAAARIEAILAAEHRRTAPAILPDDQQTRDVAVRRAAARALARIGGADARPGLLRALSDDDDEVVAWAAYGLGFFCKGHEKDTTSALVARALSRSPKPGSALDAGAAIARAIGKCGAEEAEPTLVAWLGGSRADAISAAFALGDVASAKQKLREETLAALLNLAAGSAAAPPVPEALFPVGRLDRVPLTVLDRLREVATARLAAPGDARLFAVRALGRAGDPAAPELARVLTTPATFNASERTEAARGLARLGRSGQRALATALPSLVPGSDPLALTGLVSEDFGVLLVALESVADGSDAKKTLAEVAALPAPQGAPPAVLRRLSLLRCTAGKKLAGADFRDKLLAACDVSGGGIGARAIVEVIGKSDLTGPRLAAFKERLKDPDVRAREAAIELLEQHEEVEGAAAILAEALAAKEGGVAATAAEVIAKQPQRAMEERAVRKAKRAPKNKKKVDLVAGVAAPPAPSPALVKALLDLLARPAIANDPEEADSLIDAAGALALKEAKPRLEEFCRSPYPTTREHAAKALALVGGDKKTCDAPPEGGPLPTELDHLARAPVKLALDTDAGALTLTLDPALAPVAVTRVADLVKAGYYDGIVVHRVVPAFVAQFGAPFGDGFGGPENKPAMRCETSPLPFAPLAVGVALSGRDTGSSQLFVMHGRYPHLDGGYALIGTASGPWAALAEGDVIKKITIAP